MADISIISRLVSGFQRNVDVSQNSLVVGSIKIGTSSPVEITKTIAAKLLLVQAAADADGTFDSRYTRISELVSITSGKGSALVGIQDAGNYFSGATVESALQQLGASVGSGSAAGISYSNATSGLTATNVQSAIDEVEGRVDATEIVANAAIPATQKGANNGVATLDGGGKVPVSQLPNAVMTYEGTYNATTNTPTLANGTGNAGQVYRVATAGSVDFGAGAISFAVGDYVIYSGSIWEKSDGTDSVNSVNGQQGIVVLTTTDVAEGTNQYFTDERAQDAVGTIFVDTATIDFTYNDGAPSITASVKNGSIDSDILSAAAADQDTIMGGNGPGLYVVKAPKLQNAELAAESLSANTIYAMRFGRAADAGFVAGRIYKASNDSSVSDNFDVIGLCRPSGAVSAGDPIQVVSNGDLVATSHGLTIGEPVWLGAAGALTQTAPNAVGTAVVKLGTVKDANTIRVKVQIVTGG